MSTPESLPSSSEIEDFHHVPKGSILDRTLKGLDIDFALKALTERQKPGVHDKNRQRRVVEMRYGLTSGEPMTFREIGEALGGSSIQLARQTELEARFRLKEIRDENSPEKVFPRKKIYGIDNDYLYSPSDLKKYYKRQESSGLIIKPEFEYPR